MGCDIHILFQVLDSVSNKWFLVKRDENNVVLVEDKDVPVFVLPESDDELDNAYEEFYERTEGFRFNVCRDYILFAKIANIRNEYGLLDGLEARGLPTDLSQSVRFLLDESYHSHTWLFDTEIEALNMNESPILKCSFFIRLEDYENVKKKHPNVNPTSRDIATYCLLDCDFQCKVCGFIYTVEEWEALDNERKERERTPQRRNNVYIQFSYMEKINDGGVQQFKQILTNLKEKFPGQRIRALIGFDS